MALLTCPECGRPISERATACPHCGYPIQAAPPNAEHVVGTENNRVSARSDTGVQPASEAEGTGDRSLVPEQREAGRFPQSHGSSVIEIKDAAGVVLHRVAGDTLEGAFLAHAYLRRAKLQGANLRGANLRDANLEEADLTDADLRDAQLSNTSFQSAILVRANLSGLQLSHEDRVNFRSARMHGANLSHVSFFAVPLVSVILQGANLQSADLCGCDMEYANLSGADLKGASVGGCKWSWVDVRGADLSEVKRLDSVNVTMPVRFDPTSGCGAAAAFALLGGLRGMSYRADDEADGWHMTLIVLGAIAGCFAGYYYLRGGWRFIPLPQGIQNAVVGVLLGAVAGRCLAWCVGFLRVMQKYFLQ